MTLIRYACLLLPLGLVAVAWRHARPDRRTRGAAVLGTLAAVVGLGALNVVAVRLGWWSYLDVDGAVLGLPVDLWLGWAVLWGALPVLVRVRLPLLLAGWLWLDVVAMPALAPLVELGPLWLVGEVVGFAFVALPAALLGRWAAAERHLAARAGLQMVAFGGLPLWLLPALAVELGDGSWRHLTELPGWRLSLVVQAAGLLVTPGVLAVKEFVQRGAGTPFPWDPPARLVTSGLYAYVANPMQLTGVALLFLGAGALHSWTLAGAGACAVAFSAAVAGPHEDEDLARRHGAAWSAYRSQVRQWWPCWRPYTAEPARLYLAATCELCRSTGAVLGVRRPVGLTVCAAEEHRLRLRRARYEGADGHVETGVAAIARALEHLHLGWAMLGWLLRLPGLDRIAQVIVDGLGGGPRDVPAVRSSRA